MTAENVTPIETDRKALVVHDVDGEPRIRDTDLAERLGMARPTNIRGVIEKNRAELEAYGPLHTTRAMVEIGSGAQRETAAYELNEPQAVLVCIKSAAPRAPEARREVIEGFLAWRRGLAAYGHPQTVTLRIGELKSLVREVFEAELRANPQHIAVGYLSALDIAKNHKIPAKGRRGIVISISAYMRRHCLKHGFRTRISAETGKYLFPPDAVDHWLLRGGLQVIHRHMSKLEGQGVLQLVAGGRSDGKASPS